VLNYTFTFHNEGLSGYAASPGGLIAGLCQTGLWPDRFGPLAASIGSPGRVATEPELAILSPRAVGPASARAPDRRSQPESWLAPWVVPRGGVYGSRRSWPSPGES
jgi:hypothetical protein